MAARLPVRNSPRRRGSPSTRISTCISPIPALGDFDSAAEIELALADLREQFPNFSQARILSTRVMRDDWPAQRSCAGYDLPRETGIEGLWCVGDAVKEYANGGTTACAETAQLVVDKIVAAHQAAAVAHLSRQPIHG